VEYHPSQTRARFRTPIPPRPIERVDLAHPATSPHLAPLQILHISDLHVRRRPDRGSTIEHLIDAVARTPVDLIFLTGDFMHRPGHEDAALGVLGSLADAARARLGIFAVGGNHDTPALLRRARALRDIRWLHADAIQLDPALCIVGASDPEDLASAITSIEHPAGLILALAHVPSQIVPASELGIHVLFAGHTHGGQWRIAPRIAPHTSCDLPMHLASGVLRIGNTLGVVSRGLGEAIYEARINCPRHAPLVTLRNGPMPGNPDAPADELRQVVAW